MKNKGKMTDNIQRNSHKVISWFLNRNSTSQKGVAWYGSSDGREEPTTKKVYPTQQELSFRYAEEIKSFQPSES